MRRILFPFLILCLLTSATTPGLAKRPLRLVFEKSIAAKPKPKAKDASQYTIKPGEWLYKILEARGYSKTQINQLMPTIQALNPNIADINHLQPGQVLQLPAASPQGTPSTTQTTPPKAPPITSPAAVKPNIGPQNAYLVNEGDTLFQILKNQNYPGTLPFSKYMDMVMQANPEITDPNQLRVGQKIDLPTIKVIPPPRILNRAEAPTPPPPSNAPEVKKTLTQAQKITPQVEAPKPSAPQPKPMAVQEARPQEVAPKTEIQTSGKAPTEITPEPQVAAPLEASGTSAVDSEPGPIGMDTGQSSQMGTTGGPGNIPGGMVGVPIPTPTQQTTVPRQLPGYIPPGLPPERTAPTLPVQAKPAQPRALDITQTAKPKKDWENRALRIGVPFIKTVLQQMRFTFAPGDESMFPLPGSRWLRLKMQETPLLLAPWGEKIILCPTPMPADWTKDVQSLGMKICFVSPDWSLRNVLEKLENTSPEHFRIWSADRELVFAKNGLNLTLNSPQIAITEQNGRKNIYMVWARKSRRETPLPQSLPEVLDSVGIKVIELDPANELSRLPSRPKGSIYVPQATQPELLRAIYGQTPDKFLDQPAPQSLLGLLQILRNKGALQAGTIQVAWHGGEKCHVTLQVPAWLISPRSSKIALLDRRFSDPYLISLLSGEGYKCFILGE